MVNTLLGSSSTIISPAQPEDRIRMRIELAQYGETVWIDPGTYTFRSPITVSNDGVKIKGVGKCSLIPADRGTVGLFNITGSDCSIEGVTIQDSSPVASQSVIKVTGGSFEMKSCRAIVTGSAASHIVLNVGDGTTSRAGLLIEGNEFRVSTTSTAVTLIKMSVCHNSRIIGNSFRSTSATPLTAAAADSGLLKKVIHIVDGRFCTISGNTFSELGQAATLMDAVIYTDVSVDTNEGQHISITGNFFELCFGTNLIRMVGGRFSSIVGNVIGRCGAAALYGTGAQTGVIFLTEDGASNAGASITIASNEFHNNGQPALVSEHNEGVTFTANVCSLCQTRQVDLDTTAKSHNIIGNVFVLSSGITSLAEAIRFTGAAAVQGHVLLGNHCRGLGGTPAATGAWTAILTAAGYANGTDYAMPANTNVISHA